MKHKYADKEVAKNHFLKLARDIWSDEYDYSKFVYTFSKDAGEIICKKHGSFFKSPNKHTRKGSPQGCVECSNEKLSDLKSSNTVDVLSKFREVHGERYKYSIDTEKIRMKDKIKITCKDHGDFWQSCDSHSRGNNCPMCSGGISKDYDQFLMALTEHQLKTYEYFITPDFINWSSKVDIRCKKCGLMFQLTPRDHVGGRGCPDCNKTRGWTRSHWVRWCESLNYKTVTVYVIRVYDDNEEFYKFGITNSLERRFRNKHRMPYQYDLIESIEFTDYAEAYDFENMLRRCVRGSRYKPIKGFGGETECFTKDGLEGTITMFKEFKEFNNDTR